MSDRAYVFLRRLRDQRSRFMGVLRVRPRPARGAQVQLVFRNRVESGRVAYIEPANWDGHTGGTPTIHVVQDEPE
jgi:hypothetical protein